MKKSVKIIFTLSILLNLLFAGLVGGYIYRVKIAPKPWEEVKSKLSPQTREIIRSSFKNGQGDMLSLIRDVRQKKKSMKEIITAEEFDLNAYNALVIDIQNIEADFSKRKYDKIGGILSRLPQEDRAIMADHVIGKMFGRMGNMKFKNKNFRKAKQGKGGDSYRHVKQRD